MNPKFPVIFMGTGSLALRCAQALKKHSNIELKGLISQPAKAQGRGLKTRPSPLALWADTLSLPYFTPHELKSQSFLSQIAALQADWTVVLSYGKILPSEFLSLFPKRILNFHTSLLPRWRGAAPIERAVMAGDRTLGMSLQIMEKKLDTGALIGSQAFNLSEDLDAAFAFKKMEELIPLLLEDMMDYMKGNKSPQPQEEKKASYAKKIDKKQDCRIIWSEPAVKIFNQIRGLSAGPQAYTFYKGKRLKIHKSKKICYNDKAHLKNAGSVHKIDSEGFEVLCGLGSLKIQQVHPESKKLMSAGEFIKGYPLQLGDTLE